MGDVVSPPRQPRVAVLVPCYNEEHAVASVVTGFAAALPGADIYVYDNASTDGTAQRAREAGAIVRHERRRGKGNVMRKMFADIDADVYVMVDGDGTYDPSSASAMVDLLVDQRLDMVVGARQTAAGSGGVVYRKGHTTGNAVFTRVLRTLVGGEFKDIFSGYRAMSRRFVKSLPVRSSGFEIETELSAHAVEVEAACAEVDTAYGSRQEGSTSKLNTYRDGLRIAGTILRLFESIRPLQFFAICFAALTVAGLILGVPVIDEFARTGLVLRFPTAILAVAIQIVAFLCLTCGVILKSVQRARQEGRRLVYLQIGPPSPAGRSLPSERRIAP
ncbi:MAG: glycosyltransferase [Actinomycetota bacterium]|nr:glycosyltransferase [Actinomycetota bacterium]